MDDLTDDHYADVDDTVNPDNVDTENINENVAADDAATTVPDAGLGTASGSGAGLRTAPETVRPESTTQHSNPETEKRKDREEVLKLFKTQGKVTKSRTSIEFRTHCNIDPENPDTVPDEIKSEDEIEENTLALDRDLLDPVLENVKVVTLGVHFSNLEPSHEAIDKDPIPNPREIQGYTGITDQNQVDGICQYIQALNYHKRKIYLHASELKKEIKSGDFNNSPYDYLKVLLGQAENSKFYLDRIHEKLRDLFPLTGGQKTSRTRGNNNLEENIVYLKKATELAMILEIEDARERANRAQQDLNETQAQLDAARHDPNIGQTRPNVQATPPPQTSAQSNPTMSTPSGVNIGPTGQQPTGANFNPSGSTRGFTFGVGGASRTGPGDFS